MKYCIAFLLLVLVVSCRVSISAGDPEIKTGNNIDNDVKAEIHDMAKGIYEDVQQHDIRYTASLFPKGNYVIDTLSSIVKNVHITPQPGQRNTVGEFHITGNNTRRINSVSSSIGGNKYVYYFTPHTGESYVYMFYTPGKSDSTDVLISLEFNKEGKKWWLTNIAFGLFMYKNQMAPKMMWTAYNQYLHNELVAAAFNMDITTQLLYPAMAKFRYHNEDEIIRLLNDIRKEYQEKFAFPLTINPISSKPEVYMLHSTSSVGAPQAMVVYRSSLIQSGSEALQRENNQVHLFRELLFPGILKYGDSIAYKVISDTTENATVKIFQRNNHDKHMTRQEYDTKYLYPLLPDSIVHKLKHLDAED